MRGRLRRRPGQKHADTWELTAEADPDPITGKRRRRYEVFKGPRKEAERALAKLVKAADEDGYIDPTRETVGAFLERWLRDYVETNVAPKTRMYYQQVVRGHLVPRLGTKKLQQLRSIDIVEAERFWLAEGWQRTNVRRG